MSNSTLVGIFNNTVTDNKFVSFPQAVYVIVSSRIGYVSYQGLGLFNLDFTLDLCITSDLNALQRLLFQYITPLYIIILLAVVLCLTKVKGLSKYLGQHSFLQGMWLIVLVSYLNIANSTFEILHCRYIGPDRDLRLVLVYDASVHCWSGAHLPWAIVAVSLVLFLILPFPLYTGIAIRFPKLKPLTDVYTSIYKDRHRYWVIYNLLRRLHIVIVGVFVANFILRHFYLLLTTMFSLLVFILTWPYKSFIDNYYAAVVSMLLVLFAVVTDPHLYESVDPHRAVSWTIVAVVLVSSILLLFLETILTLYSRRKKRRRLTMDEFFLTVVAPKVVSWGMAVKSCMWKTKRAGSVELEIKSVTLYRTGTRSDYSSYREPLLDSELLPPVEASSTLERVKHLNIQTSSPPGEKNSNSTVTYSEV